MLGDEVKRTSHKHERSQTWWWASWIDVLPVAQMTTMEWQSIRKCPLSTRDMTSKEACTQT